MSLCYNGLYLLIHSNHLIPHVCPSCTRPEYRNLLSVEMLHSLGRSWLASKSMVMAARSLDSAVYISSSRYARMYCPCPDAASVHDAASFLQSLLVFFLATSKKEHPGARRLASCMQTGVAKDEQCVSWRKRPVGAAAKCWHDMSLQHQVILRLPSELRCPWGSS